MIDAVSNVVTTTITVGTSPHGVAITPDGATAYVTNTTTGSVSAIATATNTATTVLNGYPNPSAVAVAPNGSFVYVTSSSNNSVVELAVATNAVIAPLVTVGTGPDGVAVTPDSSLVYVTNEGSNNVSVISNLVQAAPLSGSVTAGTAYNGQLAVTGSSGTMSYVTNVTSPDVSVSGTGAVTSPGTTPPGTYTVSGTDSDAIGDTGAWSFAVLVVQSLTTTALISSVNPSAFLPVDHLHGDGHRGRSDRLGLLHGRDLATGDQGHRYRRGHLLDRRPRRREPCDHRRL